jgi:solute carrier family 25 carnitine/acylcarnitine transporter 20/29
VERSLRKLTEQDLLVLGLSTGVVEQVISQPLLYWKNSFIQGLPFTMNPRVLYRGTFAAASNMAALTGLQFLTSGMLQRVLVGDTSVKMGWGQEVGCAFLGGALSGPVCCALELTMIQQQRFGGSFVGTCARIVRSQGPQGLMRGLACSTGREALYTAGYLGIVPATQTYLKEAHGCDPVLGNSVGAIGGGLLCAALSQPLDTAKTCMQGDIEKQKYGGTLATMRTLRKEYGSVLAIYRGYTWRAVYCIFDFFALDYLSKKIGPILYPGRCD